MKLWQLAFFSATREQNIIRVCYVEKDDVYVLLNNNITKYYENINNASNPLRLGAYRRHKDIVRLYLVERGKL